MSTSHGKYDHELKINTTTDQFSLVRDETGRSMYQVIEEIPEYQARLSFTHNDWLGGHGSLVRKSPDVYLEGQNIDTAQRGKAFLAPLICEVYEDDDTELDAALVCFLWAESAGKWLCATSGKIYQYASDDTAIDTNEAVDATETVIDVTPDPTTAIPVGSIVIIDSENMLVIANSTTTITVVRGFRGSTAATHTTATNINKNKWTAATTTVAGVLQMVEFKGIVYAARGATGAYMYSSDGATWTATDLTDSTAYGFLVAPNPTGVAENLWKYKTPNELSRTTDGRTVAAGGVAWESPTYVGETANDITNIFLSADKLYIGKEDGLYWVDSDGGVHTELPDELKINHSTDNFKYLSNWQTSTYFSLLRGGGELTTVGTYRPVSPLTDIDDIGKVGDTVGITSDRDWIYWAVDEGTNTIIYKGRENYVDNKLRWEWYPWVFLSTNACATARVAQHAAKDRRLWFGYGTHTAYVLLSDNPLADTDYVFAASGWLRMSYTYGSDPNWDKLWQSAVLEVERVALGSKTAASAGETVAVAYRDDQDTSDTTIIAAATTVGVYETNFSSALNDKKISFRLDLASDTASATPIVGYFQAKGIEIPTTIRIHEATYSLGDMPSNRVKTIRTLLRDARTSTSLVKFADLRFGQKTSGTASGDYVWCVMMPGYPKEIEVIHEKGRQPELAAQVRLMEVSFTIS